MQLMLGLFRFFSFWPLPVLHALGALMGWLVWLASASYRATFRANVAQAGLPFEVARPAIAEAGRFVGELPRLLTRRRSQSCLDNVRIAGQINAELAFAQRRGVIFFGAHCGSFELEPQVLAELYGPVTAIYRPARKAWLARLQSVARDRHNLTVVPGNLSGIRLLYKTLKANKAVAILTDQVPPEGFGIWAPFFGRPAYTMTLAVRLALQSGAVLLPMSCERLPRGKGYFFKIWPELTGLRACGKGDQTDSAGMLHAATLMNQAVEAIVLSQPGQYLWSYARYKTPRKEAV